MPIEKLIQVFVDALLPLVAGYLLKCSGKMSPAGCRSLMLVNVYFILSFMNLLSFWMLPLDSALLIIPVFSILAALISGSLGYFTFGRQFGNILDRGSYSISAMLSNIGTMGGLAGYVLFGEVGYAYTQLYAMSQNIMMVMFVFPLAQYFHDQYIQEAGGLKWHFSLREALFTKKQLSLLGALVGLGLHFANVPRPDWLMNSFGMMVHVRPWIVMVPVGYQMDFGNARLYYKKVLSLIPLRYLLVPAVVYSLARLFFSEPVVLGSILVSAAAPVAINAVITNTLYKLNVDLTVAAFIISTVSYIALFIPIMYILFH